MSNNDKLQNTPRTDAAEDRCRECGLAFVPREEMEKLERELAALCTGPFSDAKDCPVHRADVVKSASSASADEIARLREVEHAAWHALEASEQRPNDVLVPLEEALALSKLLPEAHPGNDDSPSYVGEKP